MAIIKTSKEIEVLVDDDMFEELNTYKWSLNNSGYAYAQSYKKKHGSRGLIAMHRFLTSCPKGLVVDHINGNRLDNRMENLEIVTHNENIRRWRTNKNSEKHY